MYGESDNEEKAFFQGFEARSDSTTMAMLRNMDMSNTVERKPPLCKGRWVCEANSEGL